MAIAMENQTPVVQMPLVPASPLPPPPPPPPLPQAYKHHCKVCKKGFVCGRALGGHMRAHGVADDVLSADDDDEEDNVFDDDGAGSFVGDSSSEQASPSATTSKRMYTLRANPGRLKSCRVCENCGEEFTSWKSLLDHGRCNNYEDGDGGTDGSTRRSPPLLDEEEVVEEDMALATAGWSKGKRTRRTKMMVVGNGSVTEMTRLRATSPSSEEEDLANCLVMLSSSRSAQPPPAVSDADQESCASASKDVVDRNRLLVPQPISMMAPAVPQLKLVAPPQPASTVPRGLFECKACKKVFTSHQALGGHRASHKKVKGCFAAKLESDRRERPQPVTATPRENIKVVDAKTSSVHAANADGNTSTSGVVTATAAPETAVTQANEAPSMSAASPAKKKGKVHECSICHRVFMSGQALGGHKRCHWLTTGSGDPMTGAVSKFHPIVAQDHVMHDVCQQLTLGLPIFSAAHPILDLNNVPTNPSAAMKQAAELNDSVLCLNAPASLYMPSWTAVHSNGINVNKAATSSRNVDAAGAAATEDEADSRNAKKRKISDLKDMNMAGETSPWLQVGIGLRSESKDKSIQE